MKSGKLFIITGTSAVGKTTVAKGVLNEDKNIKRSLTHTSRAPRGYEKNKVDYNFVTKEEFKVKIKKGDFLEWANNYGNLYGTNEKDINHILKSGKHALVIIDIKGALAIKKKLKNKCVTIFILPESLDQLKDRFKRRKDTSASDIKKRLETAKWELDKSSECDFWVINKENQVEATVNEVLEIISKS